MDAELEWIQSQIADFGTRDGGFRYPAEIRPSSVACGFRII